MGVRFVEFPFAVFFMPLAAGSFDGLGLFLILFGVSTIPSMDCPILSGRDWPNYGMAFVFGMDFWR